jgi:rhamnulokinase
MSRFIALDLGAESGRAMIGILDDSRLRLQQAYRFANGPVRVFDHLYWDPLRLFAEMKQGLNHISHEHGRDFVSLGVDTWGVDYALLDAGDELVGNPHVYRDPRTTGVMERMLTWLSQWEVFEQSGGVQFMTINTIYQLRAMVEQKSPQLAAAATFLMIADLFNFWLTGRKAVEFTNATTTQFFDSRTRTWALNLLQRLGAPTHIFPEVVMPGQVLGPLLPDVASEVGIEPPSVVAVATHDTASAAMAVPSITDNVAWLSSGTWSLLGAVAEQAIVTPEAMQYNISSYGGVGGKVLPWKNIMGLWLVQECRRIWAKRGDTFSYAELTQMAAEARPFVALLDPDHASFLAPADMPAAIQSYCQTTGQAIPESRGEMVRVALEGLALKYRLVIERLEALLQRRFEALHIVGGGSQNELLCQFTADVTQRPVVAGPVEATAIGNVVMQALSSGHLASIEEARRVIRDSFAVVVYEPGGAERWDEAYARFLALAAV